MSKEKFLAQYGSRKHIESALNSPDAMVRKHALLNPGMTSAEITDKLKSTTESPSILLSLLDNPNINDDHLRLAMRHPKFAAVQDAAKWKWKGLYGEY